MDNEVFQSFSKADAADVYQTKPSVSTATVFAALALLSALLNVYFVSGGGVRVANSRIKASTTKAWDPGGAVGSALGGWMSYCTDAKAALEAARMGVNNVDYPGVDRSIFDAAMDSQIQAEQQYYGAGCDGQAM